MNNKTLLKCLMIAVPALWLSACSSNDGYSQVTPIPEEEVDLTGTGGQQQTTIGGITAPVDPQLGEVAPQKTPAELAQEQLQQEQAKLRQQQIIYFDYDRSNIRQEFLPVLESHAAYLVSQPSVRILIEGHTDERGTPEYNIALSERRGKAVQRYLQSLGVLSSQMEVVSYGEEKLMNSNANEAAHAQNRRAILVY